VRYDKQGRRLYVNRAFELVTGIPPAALIGKSILEQSVLSGSAAKRVMDHILDVYATGQESTYEVSFAINGRTLHYHYRCIPELDEFNQVQSVLAVGREVTAYKDMESQLQTLATTDSLTGIANRRNFMDKLNAELSVVKRYKTSAFLFLLDLDHFKQLNDTYGHGGGDEALRFFTNLIQKSLRNTDVFARIGGEEFAIVLHASSINVAKDIAEKLRKLVEGSEFHYQQQQVNLRVSIGITDLSAADADVTIPLLRADKALYAAKANGRNQVQFNFTA
jgi:diguanylate cyclase (GGDEF)-like protein/PAS domain S-box-containing protein